LKKKCWLCPFLNAAQNPTPSCNYCSLFHLDAPCNLYSVLFTFRQASMPMCSVHSSTLCRKCLIQTGNAVSCLMKCQAERMSISIRSLTVLKVLRTMEQRGLAALQIMLHFSWSMVCIESGSNQLLTTSVVEAHAQPASCQC
jgi:hypothetical protein